MVKVLPQRIWKYNLPVISGLYSLDLPEGVKPLSVGMQNEHLCMWVKASPVAKKYGFNVNIVWTGEAPPEPESVWQFVGTAIHQEAGLVYHVYLAKKE